MGRLIETVTIRLDGLLFWPPFYLKFPSILVLRTLFRRLLRIFYYFSSYSLVFQFTYMEDYPYILQLNKIWVAQDLGLLQATALIRGPLETQEDSRYPQMCQLPPSYLCLGRWLGEKQDCTEPRNQNRIWYGMGDMIHLY